MSSRNKANSSSQPSSNAPLGRSRSVNSNNRTSSSSTAPSTSASASASTNRTTTTTTTTAGRSSHPNLEKAIFQLLSCHGCMKAEDLKAILQPIRQDLNLLAEEEGELNLSLIFASMNRRLRDLAFEIKTVVIRGNTANPSASSSSSSSSSAVPPTTTTTDCYYHGLVNLEEDMVAKEYGSVFNQNELLHFMELVEKLLLEEKLTTEQAVHLNTTKLTKNESIYLLDRLQSQGWIARDRRDYLILGPRSYLELNSYFESILINSNKLEEIEDEEERRRQLMRQLPQFLIY